jgi:membrane protein DedA with SNARE-associated domain
MSSFIDWFVRWGERLVDSIGYPGLAIIMFLENVFPPIPSEPFLLGAGFATADGKMSLPLSILAATIGSLIGATVFYFIGIALPEPHIRSVLRRYGKYALLGEEDLDRAIAWFVGHGRAVVFFGRCIPLVRTLISVPAGMTRMPLPQFLAYSAAGTALWSTFLIMVGRLLGDRYEDALVYLDRFQYLVVAVVALAIAAFVVLRVRSRRRTGAAA